MQDQSRTNNNLHHALESFSNRSLEGSQASHSKNVVVEVPKFGGDLTFSHARVNTTRRFGKIGDRAAAEEAYLLNKRDHFFAEINKPNRMYPLNMQNKNPLKMNPKSSHKHDDIERTLKVSHVEQMPTVDNNYYQEMLRKLNKRKVTSKTPAILVSPKQKYSAFTKVVAVQDT